MSVEFVAVDGEAIDDSYVLLAASTGEHILNLEGLPTKWCLDFLLDLAAPGRRIVCYGLGYDVNQWLAGVGKPALRELWATGSCIWRDYKLRWLPRRYFTIRQGGRTVKITETIGFFQTAFVKALDSWGIEPQPEVTAMKQARGRFTRTELQRVVAYCHTECDDLVELMRRLRAATIVADCEPREWIGAGALAGAMLKSRGLEAHHAHDGELTDSETAQDAIMRAYFGGRVEALRIGSYAPVRSQDVRSAYPHAATLLPSLAGATLAYARRYDPDAEHAIWRCSWAGCEGELMPFPVRNRTAIFYPRTGEGVYHACEVAAALAAGFPVTVRDGWTLCSKGRPVGHQRSGAPFAWVPDAYRIRARWQREGNAAQLALKLGLNSLYGKLAQGVGYSGGPPRWQSYFWAGEITARTRARMLTAALHSREPIAIATDGLYALQLNGARDTARLGGWELGAYDSLFVAQPGLYAAETDGELTVRSRGHFAREVDYGALREGFQADGFEHVHHYRSRRFVGLGTALMRRDMRLWRKWPDEQRSISLYPTRKVPGPDGRLHPPAGDGLDPSEPYVPKGAGINDTEVVENVQAAEQPCRDSL